MKLGDIYTTTVGREAATHASHVAAMAASSLRMVTKHEPIPPADVDAIVSDMWTIAAALADVTDRLADAAVEPHVRTALVAANQALGEARKVLHRADPESQR